MPLFDFGLEYSKPRIVYLASTLGRGLNFYFTQLAIALHRKSTNLIVVSGSKEEEVGLCKKLKNKGIKVYKTPYIDEPSLRNMFNGINFFRQLIIHENVDIIHVQTLYSLIMAFFSSRFPLHIGKKVKILYTIHSTLHGTRYERIGLFFGTQIMNLCADLVIPVSQTTAKKITKNGLCMSKVKVIYNGIDLKFFDNIINNHKSPLIPLSIKDSSNIIISYCANLIPRKGHMYLIKAISEVLKKYPKVKLILTSEGPIKNELINFTKNLGISENVYFTGRVCYEELYRILYITDIYVFPSLSELFPYAILEAMAAGKPIVATNVGGVSEAIIDGVNGYLIHPRDQTSLVGAILKFMKDMDKARRMGIEGRRLVEQRFSMDEITRKINDVYELALKKK